MSHHSSSPHTTVLILPPFSSCIFLLLWSRFAYKKMHKYIRERTSVFCQSLLWNPNIGDIYRCSSLYIFSSCFINNPYHLLYTTTQEPSVFLAGLASVSLLLQLQHPSQGWEFTDLILLLSFLKGISSRAGFFLLYRPRQILHWIPACHSRTDTARISFWRRKLHVDAHITWHSAERRYHWLVC